MPIFRFFLLFLARSVLHRSVSCFSLFSIFSYFIFLFLNFLSLFVFIVFEMARTRRFSVIFAKVQWHPWCIDIILLCILHITVVWMCWFVCHHWFVWLGLLMCTLIQYLGFMSTFFFFFFYPSLLLSMIVWTYTVLGVLYACVLYFCICTCSAQLSMFHVERRSRDTLMIIVQRLCLYIDL